MLPPPPIQDFSQVPSTEMMHNPVQQPTEIVLWSKERLALLKKTLASSLNDLEFELFTEVCKRRTLDPFAKQIYAVKRGGNMTIQTSIDGYRLIAERTGKYLGQTEPFWCGQDGVWKDVWTSNQNPFAAKVGVHKAGQVQPTWGIAYWNTYVAPGPFWQKAGPHMLAKCAEALALKKAFPEELSGLYTDDEMAQADTPSSFREAKAILAQPIQAVSGSDAIQLKDIKSVDEEKAEVVAVDTQDREWVFRGEWMKLAVDYAGKPDMMMIDYVKDGNRYVVTTAQV